MEESEEAELCLTGQWLLDFDTENFNSGFQVGFESKWNCGIAFQKINCKYLVVSLCVTEGILNPYCWF